MTKYLGATNTRSSRIKASCERGSITISYPHELPEGEETHRAAASALVAKFLKEDEAKYGSRAETNGWGQPFVSGGPPNGNWAHVFISRKR